jgi:hypothetical protein
MSIYLITVRDERRELECTSQFEANNKPDAKKLGIEYYAAELKRPANKLRVVSALRMEAA